jgi:hypothetical protein
MLCRTNAIESLNARVGGQSKPAGISRPFLHSTGKGQIRWTTR